MSRQAPPRSIRSRQRASALQPDAPEVFEMPPLDEKHRLIEEHAERRAEHPAGNVFAMYIGVAICSVLIVVGWIISLPKTLASGGGSDSAIEATKTYGSAFTQSVAKEHPFQETGKLLEKLANQQDQPAP